MSYYYQLILFSILSYNAIVNSSQDVHEINNEIVSNTRYIDLYKRIHDITQEYMIQHSYDVLLTESKDDFCRRKFVIGPGFNCGGDLGIGITLIKGYELFKEI